MVAAYRQRWGAAARDELEPMLDVEHLALVERAALEVAGQRSGDRVVRRAELAGAVRWLSDHYNRGQGQKGQLRPPTSPVRRHAELAARLCFFTLADLPKVAYPLAELHERGQLPEGPLRVLDVGAGCGAQSLGLLSWLGTLDRDLGARASRSPALRLDALDADRDALAAMQALIDRVCELAPRAPRPVDLRCVRADVRQLARRADSLLDGRGRYDLILLGSVLAELPAEEHESLLVALLQLLSSAGSLLVIEPALRQTARALHTVRDRLLARGAAHVFAPCTHQGPCPALNHPGDWCHERRSWHPPSGLAELAAVTGLRRGALKWSYVTLRRQPAGRDHEAAAGGLPLYRVVSSVIRSKGKRELFLCGAAGRLRALRLDRHASAANAAFAGLDRGALVRLDDVGREGGTLRVFTRTVVHAEDPAATSQARESGG